MTKTVLKEKIMSHFEDFEAGDWVLLVVLVCIVILLGITLGVCLLQGEVSPVTGIITEKHDYPAYTSNITMSTPWVYELIITYNNGQGACSVRVSEKTYNATSVGDHVQRGQPFAKEGRK